MSVTDDLAALLWQFGEPVNAVAFYAPEMRAATDGVGLKGGWMSYFGWRAAPLGAASAALVTAAFYVFRPSMVERAIPDAWSLATPQQILEARWAAMDVALHRVLGDGPEIKAAAELARSAVESGDFAGRVIGAANAALTPPDEPRVSLWQALATLREARGDGHVATLVTHGVAPCEALVLQAATGRSPEDGLRANRGWSDDEWNAAHAALVARGWVDLTGAITTDGQSARTTIEADTNRLAAAALSRVGDDRLQQLVDALRPLATQVMRAGVVPALNNMGFRWPP